MFYFCRGLLSVSQFDVVQLLLQWLLLYTPVGFSGGSATVGVCLLGHFDSRRHRNALGAPRAVAIYFGAAARRFKAARNFLDTRRGAVPRVAASTLMASSSAWNIASISRSHTCQQSGKQKQKNPKILAPRIEGLSPEGPSQQSECEKTNLPRLSSRLPPSGPRGIECRPVRLAGLTLLSHRDPPCHKGVWLESRPRSDCTPLTANAPVPLCECVSV